MKGKKCKYYRESDLLQYTPECCGDAEAIHPDDIDGEHCMLCGRKIKLKDGVEPPFHLLDR